MMLEDATCTVTVTRPAPTSLDELGIAVRGEPEVEDVDGVLVDAVEGSEAQSFDAGSERRVQAILMLHIPKSYTRSLLGCRVSLPAPWDGEQWDVEGDPMPYVGRLTPGPWNRKAYVTRPDL